MATHSMFTVVPIGEVVQLSCVDPSTVKAGHSGAKWKDQGVSSIAAGIGELHIVALPCVQIYL